MAFFCIPKYFGIILLGAGSVDKVIQGLLVIDLVILNHSQVTWSTSDPAPHSSTYHPTPVGSRLSFKQFNVHQPLLHGGSLSGSRTRTIHTPATSTRPQPLDYYDHIELLSSGDICSSENLKLRMSLA
ncbi:hypothetical protein TNCV_2354691 [Trichonephila clavipes]|nr:hypothetical protein TNCV_2354691 [Trichonephila clavipes]